MSSWTVQLSNTVLNFSIASCWLRLNRLHLRSGHHTVGATLLSRMSVGPKFQLIQRSSSSASGNLDISALAGKNKCVAWPMLLHSSREVTDTQFFIAGSLSALYFIPIRLSRPSDLLGPWCALHLRVLLPVGETTRYWQSLVTRTLFPCVSKFLKLIPCAWLMEW